MYLKIKEDIKIAMREKDTLKRDALRMVIDKANSFAKDSKCEIDNDIIIMSVKKEIKQLEQTLDSLVGRESSELFVSCKAKIELLNGYMPKQKTPDEVRKYVIDVIDNLNLNNMNINIGSIMKIVSEDKTIDGKIASGIIKELLNGR